MKLTNQQKKAGFFEFAIGVPLNAVLFCVFYFYLLPDYTDLNTAADRLAFAVRCSALPGATMLFGLWAVALGRGTSRAIDPFAGAESRGLQVNIRYLQNTLEQLVLFFVSALALSTFLDGDGLKIIPACALLFFINRFLFWIGYHRDPMLRGLGLSGTLYPVSFMMLAALYHGFCYIFVPL